MLLDFGEMAVKDWVQGSVFNTCAQINKVIACSERIDAVVNDGV